MECHNRGGEEEERHLSKFAYLTSTTQDAEKYKY